MDDTAWKTILANGVYLLLAAVAYGIREWINSRHIEQVRLKAESDRQRIENKLDGNTALTATSLVSSGNLPKAAPCIPAVAASISCGPAGAAQNAVDYATLATQVAHETMARENIPIQSQELLLQKMKAMLDETVEKVDNTTAAEKRHTMNNLEWIKTLNNELSRLKDEMANFKEKDKS